MRYFDAIVIGGGVLGCFTARNLRRFEISTLLLEKESDVCTGITRANTAIVYAGYDNKQGSLKARLTVRANADFEALCHTLEVPFKRCGSLMVSTGHNGDAVLRRKLAQGQANGVPGLQLLSGSAARAMEPGLTAAVYSALYAPTTGTVNPWQLGIAAFENAIKNGCAISLNTCVLNIERRGGRYIVETEKETFCCKAVLNCAGLGADGVQELLFSPSVRIFLDAGDYIVLDRSVLGPQHIIFEEPEQSGKGITVVPTVEGSLLLGPTQRTLTGEPYATEENGLKRLRKQTAALLPNVDLRLTIRSFAAVRPNPYYVTKQNGVYKREEKSIGSFVIAQPAPGFYSFIGIKTPGLTCADVLGDYVAQEVAAYLGVGRNSSFVAGRKAIGQVHGLDEEARAALVAQNPDYGEMVCRCEDVSKAEVLEAIQRGARTVDGVKRRVGAGLGICQGGRCQLAIERLLEEARHGVL